MGRIAILAAIGVASAAFVLGGCGSSNAGTASSAPSPGVSSGSPTATAISAAQADLQVKEGVHAIDVALQSWAIAQPSPHYPERATRLVLLKTMPDPWPINPFTGTAMKPGASRGDYQYSVATNKKQCRVTALLSDDSLYAEQTLHIQ
jgi:hypothetical protein